MQLLPHPGAAAPNLRIEATLLRRAQWLDCTFIVQGDDSGALAWPEPIAPTRADNLWRGTCFEVFLQGEGCAGYVEVNASPSTQWAAYVFQAYREGMANAPATAHILEAVADDKGARLSASINLEPSLLRADQAWRVGVTAVLATRTGALSYWALSHPRTTPDFHDSRGFIALLEPPP
jgi:hypothetical protein